MDDGVKACRHDLGVTDGAPTLADAESRDARIVERLLQLAVWLWIVHIP